MLRRNSKSSARPGRFVAADKQERVGASIEDPSVARRKGSKRFFGVSKAAGIVNGLRLAGS